MALEINHNPDVLLCLANLSNDEVFTPPNIANAMLDLLPEDLWSNPEVTFLDPCCKSGVFLREIAKRLIKGLERKIPNLEERLDHIYHKQLFGIAITELTALLSRRSLYCSKHANSKWSVTPFDTPEGNIAFPKVDHTWDGNRCIHCGASKDVFGNRKETHAYAFIHDINPEELFKMKFDVIIGNPPYQLSDGGAGASAMPIYNFFVEQAKKLNPRHLVMVIPSRWFAGGRALDSFRNAMLNDQRIECLIDYQNSKDCFPGVDIAGGVCYFLWNRTYKGLCNVTNCIGNNKNLMSRKLNEFDKFIRSNIGLTIIHKILEKNEIKLSNIMPNYNPFLIRSFKMGKEKPFKNSLKLHSSKGISYIEREKITKNIDLIDKYKVIIGKVSSEHAGIPDKNGQYKILSNLRILKPNEICSESYALLSVFMTKEEAEQFAHYMSKKLPRFLIFLTLTSINFTQSSFQFVPMQDFSKPWTDEELYKKYGLTKEEIAFIESMIKPMEVNLDE